MSDSQQRPLPVEVIDFGEQPSILEMDEDTLEPTLTYRWVKDSPARTRVLRSRGFDFVDAGDLTQTQIDELRDLGELTPEHGPVSKLGAAEKSPDGRIRVPGMVLMACPRERSDRRNKQKVELNAARLGEDQEKFKEEAERHKVKLITVEGPS